MRFGGYHNYKPPSLRTPPVTPFCYLMEVFNKNKELVKISRGRVGCDFGSRYKRIS